MVGILAELERSLIQERTKAQRPAGGCLLGENRTKGKTNPATSHPRQKADRTRRTHDIVAKSFDVSRRTLYRVLKLNNK